MVVRHEAGRGYVYGPVPSRRLGRSLGVDLVPHKTCDFNCIYCQLGPTPWPTLQRAEYVPVEQVVREVQRKLAEGPEPDYVTLAGSGEPTLHTGFGEVTARIKQFTAVPIALLTNGSLFWMPEVRDACGAIDLLLPSLDAGDEETFQRINRPCAGLTLEKVVAGLAAARSQFRGQMWVEVFIVEGVNSSDEQVLRIRGQLERIRPHRVQINTAVRPPAEPSVRVPAAERLERIRELLGPGAEIIVPLPPGKPSDRVRANSQDVLAMLRRRPCTARDVAQGLGIGLADAEECLRALLNEGAVQVRQRLYETYFEAVRPEGG